MYTSNPQMPKIRMEAVRLVKYRGWSTRKVARHFGFTQSVFVKWCQKDPTGGWWRIPTESSKPKHHPKQLAEDVIQMFLGCLLAVVAFVAHYPAFLIAKATSFDKAMPRGI